MKSQQYIRKRSFLLFELLVSLGLICLCLFPLLNPHVKIRKIENGYLERVFFERHAQNAFCALKEELYEHKIEWNNLIQGVKGTLRDDQFVFLKRQYECDYEITMLDTQTQQSPKETLIALEATFTFRYKHKSVKPYTFAFNVGKKYL